MATVKSKAVWDGEKASKASAEARVKNQNDNAAAKLSDVKDAITAIKG